MSRHREESYTLDRVGNLSREVDDVKGQDGMSEDNGLVTITGGDTGSPVVVKELAVDARAENIIKVEAVETSGGAGSITIHSATTDSGGSITDTTDRSVTIPLDANGYLDYDYKGKEFSEDAIAVTSATTAEIGVATIVDNREDVE